MPFFGLPIRNGLPIGLGSVAGFGVQQFDPSQLFAGGTVAGAWYDPSDLSTMFTTSAGTTPVAMPGLGSAVSVGLMLDKSQGPQRFWSGYFDGSGSYLSMAANAAFEFGGGDFTVECWIYPIAFQTADGAFMGNGAQAGSASWSVGGTTAGAVSFAAWSGGTTVLVNFSTSNGVLAFKTWSHVAITRNGNLYTIWVNGVSSATSTVSGTIGNTGRPAYVAYGFGGGAARFQNIYVSNVRWVKGTALYTGTFTPPSPVTGLTAISGTSLLTCQNSTFIDNSGNSVAITVNGGAITSQNIPLGNHAISFNNTTARPELRARVNLLVATATLSTQSVTTQAASYTLRFAGAGSITLSGTATGSYSAGTHTITCTAGTLTLTVSGTVTTADLRPANSGALLPAYQAVVDANTYDTSGFPLYLRFDGIDDSMYTPANLNLSGTDKVAVFAGVRKLTAGTGQLVELSSAVSTNNGAFSMPSDSGTGTWGTASKGTAISVFLAESATNSYVAPVTTANTGLHDLSLATGIARLRVNGSQVAATSAGTAGGNFGTYPLYIGARNNNSLWFNGHLHSLIIAGSAVSAGNISATEQWVAGKTGLVI